MMPERHPDEIELLEYTEGERPEVAAHLADCLECAQRIRLLEAGREALRSAPLLELPAERRARIMRTLPEAEPKGRSWWRPLGVIVPVAAAIAAVAALAIVNSGGDEDASRESGRAAGAGGAEVATPTQDQSAGATTAAQDAFRLVAGSAPEVAAFLSERGFDARVRGGRVIVRSDDPAAVRRALEERPPGDVRVIVRNP